MIDGKGVMGSGAFEDNNKSRLARLNSFRVGNTEFGKVVAVTAERGKLPLIGTEFLSRFVVTLNYPAGEMLLVPSDGDKPRDNVFTTGIGVVRDASGHRRNRGCASRLRKPRGTYLLYCFPPP